ncbi:MAG: NAD(P)H-hydrate epimerase [Actinomycetota bacterium]|nr:NAD(P)H-hydrate epimerase [Actinomycetota bacterium]
MRSLPWEAVPALTARQMAEVDRIMVEELGIGLVQMMENAGRSLAELVMRRFTPGSALVLAGTGGNGGGGLAGARHLANRGVEVAAVLAGPVEALSPVTRVQLDILERLGVQVTGSAQEADVVIDALIGYSLQGDPQGRAAELIEWANLQSSPVLSLDAPSGLDVTTGLAGSPCATASATLTLALPKVGLRSAGQVGELYLADISVPPLAYLRLGLEVPRLFIDEGIVRIERGPGGNGRQVGP